MWTRKELKERAKVAFKANYWSCVLVAFILTALIGGGVFGASSLGKNSTDTANVTNDGQAFDFEGDTININGVEFDISTIDGAGISEALDVISEGLTNGELNINGKDIDVTDKDEIAAIEKAIKGLQDADLSEYSHDDLKNGFIGLILAIGGILLTFIIIAGLIKIFVFNPLVVGCEGFFMVNSQEKAEVGEIKRGFSPKWLHNVGTMLLKDIFLLLWSMLFVIPGMIKSYSYAMVPFILAEKPELGATEAITLSRKMMDGNKWKTFVLDLSFIGWEILSVITCGLVGLFYVNPYVYGTYAELYNTLKKEIAE